MLKRRECCAMLYPLSAAVEMAEDPRFSFLVPFVLQLFREDLKHVDLLFVLFYFLSAFHFIAKRIDWIVSQPFGRVNFVWSQKALKFFEDGIV